MNRDLRSGQWATARTAIAVMLACGALLPLRSWASPPAPARRIAVFDIQAEGISGSDVAQLPDLIGQIVESHDGLKVVPAGELHRALQSRDATQPGCGLSETCRGQVARELHAELIVSGALVKRDRGFALTLSLLDPHGVKPPVRTSETMRFLKSLGLNAKLCLDRLLQGISAPPAQETRSASAPAPPLAASPLPAAPPPPVATPRAPRTQRVLVLELRGIDVDDATAAPFTGLIAEQIAAHPGYDVASADDVHRLLEQQVRKDVAGCAQDNACVTEISRKLNADLIINGTLGRIGGSYVLTLTALRPADVKAGSQTSETATRPQDLISALPSCLERLLHWKPAAPATFHPSKEKNLSFAVFDLKPTGLSPETAANLTQVLTTEVKGLAAASVVSRDDITAMLQLESAKMKAGCDDASCMAELGGALGVDRLITGDAGKVGTQYIVNLRLLDVRHAVVENRVTESFEGDEEQLLRAVRTAARRLLGLGASGKGELAITASQNAAAVFVDDGEAGNAPARVVSLMPGKHAVRIAAGGYFDWHGDVYVDPLETTSIWAQLSARPQAWYQKWWVWTIAGAVVAGGVTAGVVVTRPAPTTGGGKVVYP